MLFLQLSRSSSVLIKNERDVKNPPFNLDFTMLSSFQQDTVVTACRS